MTRYLTVTLLAFFGVLWIKLIYPISSGLPDTDFFWHLAYGHWILEHGQLPPGDTFSWTHAGQPYQLTQWLGEVFIALAYNAAGPLGTTILGTVLAGAAIAFAWRSAARYVASPVALTLAVLCNAILIVMAMRPQMFSFTATAVAIYVLLRWLESPSFRHAAAYMLVMALWTNLHGAFVVGLLLVGILAVGTTIQYFAGPRDANARRQAIGAWALCGAATLATGINPYGFAALTNVFMIAGLQSAQVIIEWRPVMLTTATGWFYLMYALPFLGLLIVTPARLAPTQLLFVIFALIFGLQANRQVAIGGALMAPFIAMLLARTPQYANMLPTIKSPARPILVSAGMLILTLLAFPIVSFGQQQLLRNLDQNYPVQAVDFLERNSLTGRVMSDTLEASYLIHRNIPVYLDGRMDLYRDAFFFRWWLAQRGAPNWEQVVTDADPTAMLLRRPVALRQLLLASNHWKLVFDDTNYSVLVPIRHPLPAITPVHVDYQTPDGGPVLNYLE